MTYWLLLKIERAMGRERTVPKGPRVIDLDLLLYGMAEIARTAYHDFFVLWKDADPDVPVLISATSEYAKLA